MASQAFLVSPDEAQFPLWNSSPLRRNNSDVTNLFKDQNQQRDFPSREVNNNVTNATRQIQNASSFLSPMKEVNNNVSCDYLKESQSKSKKSEGAVISESTRKIIEVDENSSKKAPLEFIEISVEAKRHSSAFLDHEDGPTVNAIDQDVNQLQQLQQLQQQQSQQQQQQQYIQALLPDTPTNKFVMHYGPQTIPSNSRAPLPQIDDNWRVRDINQSPKITQGQFRTTQANYTQDLIRNKRHGKAKIARAPLSCPPMSPVTRVKMAAEGQPDAASAGKRTVSFEFEQGMNDRQIRGVVRKMMAAANGGHPGSYSGSSLIDDTEEEEEEEDPLPVLALQDPPKPKLKRQLSSDSDSLSSANLSAANSTGGSSFTFSPNKQSTPSAETQSQHPVKTRHQFTRHPDEELYLAQQQKQQQEQYQQQQQQQQRMAGKIFQQQLKDNEMEPGQHQRRQCQDTHLNQKEQYLIDSSNFTHLHDQRSPTEKFSCFQAMSPSIQNIFPVSLKEKSKSFDYHGNNSPGFEHKHPDCFPKTGAQCNNNRFDALGASPKKSPKRLKCKHDSVISPVQSKLSPLIYDTNSSAETFSDTPLLSPSHRSLPCQRSIKSSTPKPLWAPHEQSILDKGCESILSKESKVTNPNFNVISPRRGLPARTQNDFGYVSSKPHLPLSQSGPKDSKTALLRQDGTYFISERQEQEFKQLRQVEGVTEQEISRPSGVGLSLPEIGNSPKGNIPEHDGYLSFMKSTESQAGRKKNTLQHEGEKIAKESCLPFGDQHKDGVAVQPSSPSKSKFSKRSKEPEVFIFPDVSKKDEVDGDHFDAPMDMDYYQESSYQRYSYEQTPNYGSNYMGESLHFGKQPILNTNSRPNFIGSDIYSQRLLQNKETTKGSSYNLSYRSHRTLAAQEPSLNDYNQQYRIEQDQRARVNVVNSVRDRNFFQQGSPCRFGNSIHNSVKDTSHTYSDIPTSTGMRSTYPSQISQKSTTSSRHKYGDTRPLSVAANRVRLPDTYAEVLDTSEPDGVVHFMDKETVEELRVGQDHFSERWSFEDGLKGDYLKTKHCEQTPGSFRGSRQTGFFGSAISTSRPMTEPKESRTVDRGISNYASRGNVDKSSVFTRADTNVLFISPDELSGSSMSCGDSSHGSGDNYDGGTSDCIPGADNSWDEMDGDEENARKTLLTENDHFKKDSSIDICEHNESQIIEEKNKVTERDNYGVFEMRNKAHSVECNSLQAKQVYRHALDKHYQHVIDVEHTRLSEHFQSSYPLPHGEESARFILREEQGGYELRYTMGCNTDGMSNFDDNTRRSEDDDISGDEVDGFGEGEEKKEKMQPKTLAENCRQSEAFKTSQAPGNEDETKPVDNDSDIVHIFDDNESDDEVDGATVARPLASQRIAPIVDVFDPYEDNKRKTPENLCTQDLEERYRHDISFTLDNINTYIEGKTKYNKQANLRDKKHLTAQNNRADGLFPGGISSIGLNKTENWMQSSTACNFPVPSEAPLSLHDSRTEHDAPLYKDCAPRQPDLACSTAPIHSQNQIQMENVVLQDRQQYACSDKDAFTEHTSQRVTNRPGQNSKSQVKQKQTMSFHRPWLTESKQRELASALPLSPTPPYKLHQGRSQSCDMPSSSSTGPKPEAESRTKGVNEIVQWYHQPLPSRSFAASSERRRYVPASADVKSASATLNRSKSYIECSAEDALLRKELPLHRSLSESSSLWESNTVGRGSKQDQQVRSPLSIEKGERRASYKLQKHGEESSEKLDSVHGSSRRKLDFESTHSFHNDRGFPYPTNLIQQTQPIPRSRINAGHTSVAKTSLLLTPSESPGKTVAQESSLLMTWGQVGENVDSTFTSASKLDKDQQATSQVFSTEKDKFLLSPVKKRKETQKYASINLGQLGATASSTVSKSDTRRGDEVDLRLEIRDVMQETSLINQRLEETDQSTDRQCECAQVEREILTSAKQLFQRLCSEYRGHENWQEELRKTAPVIRSALDRADSLRAFCRHGRRIQDVLPGSVIIRVKCPTLNALVDLCHLHESGDLHGICNEMFKVSERLSFKELTLRVTLEKTSVEKCYNYLLTTFQSSTVKAKSSPKKTSPKKSSPAKRVVRSTENLMSPSSPQDPQSWKHGRCFSTPVLSKSSPLCSPSTPRSPSTPTNYGTWSTSSIYNSSVFNRRRKFSFGETGARIAFQELNITDTESQQSPTLAGSLKEESPTMAAGSTNYDTNKRLPSPSLGLTSPRRRNSPATSPLSSPLRLKRCDAIQEQENIQHNS
ncbi:hypothetical protein PoB_006710700 [Plakobranchus ocellatus]|uniref:Uncharacterized protein n=1 Tax=Plakobranchus ocellatus TaxID=259542 RepID=A0AAV4D8Y3_9GAST|nr:hypothetical protein PoB_006710700 [Plakobranchus ocellatus]